jgi:hypothetical protein
MAAPRKHPPSNALLETERLAAQGHSVIGIARALGVSKGTFKRWCEENDALLEAFEVGRDSHRQYLVSLIVEAAKANKGANANAMFLLKTMHGFREFDSANTKVDVNVAVAQPVMIVKDFGTDSEWQAKALAQQKALTLDAAHIAPALPIHEPVSLPAPVAVSACPCADLRAREQPEHACYASSTNERSSRMARKRLSVSQAGLACSLFCP